MGTRSRLRSSTTIEDEFEYATDPSWQNSQARTERPKAVGQSIGIGIGAARSFWPNHVVVERQAFYYPDTALRLARYFGNSAQFWLNLQTRFDLVTTEAAIGERIKAEVVEAT